MEQKEIKEQQIQIEIDDLTAQGVYSNLAVISHSPDEFILDFIFIQPQVPKAKVRARVVTSPGHIKRFLAALQDNIKKYEEKFGEIKTESKQMPKIGFVH
ncbi:MAG: DUF3467 domain-containing protein [Endomicrobia bacterium]|nr:DUF3467 domain-containing protein [Endomicrobiia bacterium]